MKYIPVMSLPPCSETQRTGEQVAIHKDPIRKAASQRSEKAHRSAVWAECKIHLITAGVRARSSLNIPGELLLPIGAWDFLLQVLRRQAGHTTGTEEFPPPKGNGGKWVSDESFLAKSSENLSERS